MAKRVKTGIKGFDELVEGGFPSGFNILVIGTPGTGKTLFALEFAYNGAVKFDEKAMFITFEQKLTDLREQAKNIGFDVEKAEKNGSLILREIPGHKLGSQTIEKIKEEVTKKKIKRLVIDSLTTLSVNAPIYTSLKDIVHSELMDNNPPYPLPIFGDILVKRFLYNFVSEIKDLDCTTLLVSEAPEKGEFLTRDTVSEFVADGILQLTFESLGGDYSRSLLVRKMRGTKNNEDIHPLEISKNGIIVHNVKS